jgi:hypothetical protein
MRAFLGDVFREKKRRKINSENVPQKGSRNQHSKMDARSKKLSSCSKERIRGLAAQVDEEQVADGNA